MQSSQSGDSQNSSNDLALSSTKDVIREIINPSNNIELIASAGTGKTFSLVLRLLCILYKEDISPSSILVVTFTKKATNEIIDRIFEKLTTFLDRSKNTALEREMIMSTVGIKTDELFYDKTIEVLQRIINEFSAIKVRTLDSFFYSIVSMFPIETQTNIEELLSEQEANLLTQISARSSRYQLFSSIELQAPLMKLFNMMSDLSIDKLQNLIINLNTKSGLSTAQQNIIKSVSNLDYVGGLNNYIASYEELISKTIPEKIELFIGNETIRKHKLFNSRALNSIVDKLEANILSLDSNSLFYYRQISNAINEIAKSSIFNRAKLDEAINKAYEKGLSDDEIDNITLAYDTLWGALQTKYVLESQTVLYLTLIAYYKYSTKLTEIQKKQDAYYFNDILQIAYKLLSNGKIAEHNKDDNNIIEGFSDYFYFKLDGKISHILIDEFQDTSQLQWDILEPLVVEAMSGLGVNDYNKSFFYVGDAKQTLYRFRGSEPTLFSRVKKSLLSHFYSPNSDNSDATTGSLEHLKSITMQVNYRSDKAIINKFVNPLFDYVAKYVIANLEIFNYREQAPKSDNDGFFELMLYNEDEIKRREKEQLRELTEYENDNDDNNNDESSNESNALSSIKSQNKTANGGDEEEKTPIIYLEYVQKSIKRAIESGYSYKNIAILVETNRIASNVADYLNGLTTPIPVRKTFRNFLSNTSYFKVVLSLLHYFCTKDKTFLWEYVYTYPALTATSSKNEPDIAAKAVETVKDIIEDTLKNKTETIKEKLLYILSETKFFDRFNKNASELYIIMDIIASIQIKNDVTLYINELIAIANNTLIPTNNTSNEITVMTIHSSKGLEFPVVIALCVSKTKNMKKDDILLTEDNKIYKHNSSSIHKNFFYNQPDLVLPEIENNVLHNELFVSIDEMQKLINEEELRRKIDEINRMYVVLTRAKESLFVVAQYKENSKDFVIGNALNEFITSNSQALQEYTVLKSTVDQIDQTLIPTSTQFEDFIKGVSYGELAGMHTSMNTGLQAGGVNAGSSGASNATKMHESIFDSNIRLTNKSNDNTQNIKSYSTKYVNSKSLFNSDINKVKTSILLQKKGEFAHKILSLLNEYSVKEVDFIISSYRSYYSSFLTNDDILDVKANIIDLLGNKIFKEIITNSTIYKEKILPTVNNRVQEFIRIDFIAIKDDNITILDFKYSEHINHDKAKAQLSNYGEAIKRYFTGFNHNDNSVELKNDDVKLTQYVVKLVGGVSFISIC